MAALRAVHQVLDGEPKILTDAPIVQLLGRDAIEQLRVNPGRFQTPGAMALRAHVLLRSRFAEDRLSEAFACGVRQYIVLGAGLDTFAYRHPAWARHLRIFEVDHPASQQAKRDRLSAAGIGVPDNLVFAPVDFEHDALADVLASRGVDFAQPVFVSWLGVTMYLTDAAVMAVLAMIVGFPARSEIVFTFAQPRAPGESYDGGPSLAERAAEAGEPWLSYFEPAALRDRLTALGYSSVEFLTAERAASVYFADRSDGLQAPRRVSIASATV